MPDSCPVIIPYRLVNHLLNRLYCIITGSLSAKSSRAMYKVLLPISQKYLNCRCISNKLSSVYPFIKDFVNDRVLYKFTKDMTDEDHLNLHSRRESTLSIAQDACRRYGFQINYCILFAINNLI